MAENSNAVPVKTAERNFFRITWNKMHFKFYLILPLKLCCDCRFQRVITACSWVFKFEITAWKLKSVATVFGFWSVKSISVVKMNHSILLKYTNVDINSSSKLKILLKMLRFEFSIETFLSAENSTLWVFKLWNHTSMCNTYA